MPLPCLHSEEMRWALLSLSMDNPVYFSRNPIKYCYYYPHISEDTRAKEI